jgi:hypothetical protein
LGVSRQGDFKNTIKIFWQKVRVETFPKISTKIPMSVFPRLLLFYRIFGCFSAMGVQKHCKKRFAKKIVSKSFYKKIDQKSKTDFFTIFCLSRFWVFLAEESSKTLQKKYRKKINLTLVLFWPLTHPPTTGVADLFFNWRPLALLGAGLGHDMPTCQPEAPWQSERGYR